MGAIIIDGKATAAKHREQAKETAGCLKERGILPCLAVILVGEDPASLSYVTAKQKALNEAGMESRDIRLDAATPETELLTLIASLNADENVHGILVQLPLPKHVNEQAVIAAIDPRKDVDCFHPVNVGRLLLGEDGFLPCTPLGIVHLLKEMNINTHGTHVVVVGRSNIVGKPVSILLARRDLNATVTMCHTGTKDLSLFTQQADILIAAVGKAGLITGGMIKKGAAVIDVGVNRVIDSSAAKGFRLKGDVNFEEAKEVAGWITPVPGGVGPMTIAMLLRNVLAAAAGNR